MTAPYYQDEFVTLYHGNCMAVEEWQNADVLVTDPPYGISWKSNTQHYSKAKINTKEIAIANDESVDLRDKVIEVWGKKPAIVFGSWKMPRPKNTKQRLIWHKTKLNPGFTTAPWFSAEEEIYIIGQGFSGKPSQNVIETFEARGGGDGLAAVTGHPTPKPVGLMEQLIEKCPFGVIADPFAGSGATLIAARNLARFAIGVELEEKYCELIANRLSQGVFYFEV
jgi:site-specific DNA-methyltransferase (adenine-specific)